MSIEGISRMNTLQVWHTAHKPPLGLKQSFETHNSKAEMLGRPCLVYKNSIHLNSIRHSSLVLIMWNITTNHVGLSWRKLIGPSFGICQPIIVSCELIGSSFGISSPMSFHTLLSHLLWNGACSVFAGMWQLGKVYLLLSLLHSLRSTLFFIFHVRLRLACLNFVLPIFLL